MWETIEYLTLVSQRCLIAALSAEERFNIRPRVKTTFLYTSWKDMVFPYYLLRLERCCKFHLIGFNKLVLSAENKA